MQKIYKNPNGTISVTLPESCDRERLMSVTEDFLKKVINGGYKVGNNGKTSDFRKK